MRPLSRPPVQSQSRYFLALVSIPTRTHPGNPAFSAGDSGQISAGPKGTNHQTLGTQSSDLDAILAGAGRLRILLPARAWNHFLARRRWPMNRGYAWNYSSLSGVGRDPGDRGLRQSDFWGRRSQGRTGRTRSDRASERRSAARISRAGILGLAGTPARRQWHAGSPTRGAQCPHSAQARRRDRSPPTQRRGRSG
jgi:hypothetical protein